MSLAIISHPDHTIALARETNIYLDHVARTKAPSTVKTYTGKINVFTDWMVVQDRETPLKAHLEAFRSYVSARYGSANTKNLMLTVVRNLFRYLYEAEILDHDPAKHLKNFKTSDGHTKSALDKYQLSDLLDHISGETLRNRSMITLAISNGLRVNEIANIELSDFDVKDGDHIIWLLRKGYTGKDCYTILAPDTHRLLMEYIADRSDGYLFASQKGGGLDHISITKLVKKILRDAGIDSPSITAHSMRHTFARLCIEADVNITQVMTALNHKNLSSTQIYYRAYERHSKSAEKAFDLYG